MARPVQPDGAALRALILALAATDDGYSASQSHHLHNHEQSAKACDRLIYTKKLYRAKVKGYFMRYFTTPEAVAAWKARTPPKVIKYQRRDSPAVKTAKLVKVRPVKAHKPIFVKQAPALPTTPRADAVIIWPDHIRPVCRMMAPPRNQVVTLRGIHYGHGAMA